MGEPDDRWYFSKDRLHESPSRRHGYDGDKELSCRQQAANFIQDMGQKLHVSQLCINTAIVYMHRFYVFHSLVQFHRNAIATAALFLAAKVEEQPRKVEHVLKVAHMCLHRETPSLDTKSELYQEQSNDLVVNESILLQTLGFDVAIDHPHTHVVRCCQLVKGSRFNFKELSNPADPKCKASKDLAQTSYFMASNSLHLTTMCLQYKPTVVACFCIHLACKWSNWEIPQSSEGKDWFWYVNQSVTLDLLEQLTSEFLLIFDKCPTKLKRKMMSMNQNNPPVNFGHSGGSTESYHFDEPRKLMGAEANRPPDGFLPLPKAAEKVSASANNGANAGNNPALAAQPGQAHPTRHIDYKEYKEKKERERQDRERADRDRTHRDPFNPSHAPTHGTAKPMEKMKVPQRPQTGPPPHKIFPQQRPHPTNPTGLPLKEAPTHPQRPPVKDATKRKFDEMENGGQSSSDPQFPDPSHLKGYPRNPEDLRLKPGHYQQPTPSFSGPGMDHAQSKDLTASGIRDIITQSIQREKPHRPTGEERPYQNYPYQRTGMEKYGATSRPTQPSVIAKPQRDDAGKKPEEVKLEEQMGAPDWHGKPPSSGNPHQHSSLPHGADRFNGPGKAAMAAQQKSRDPKFKAHNAPAKDGAVKPPGNLMQPGMGHPAQALPHKKPTEKPIDKNRKFHEPPTVMERGLPASMESLIPPDDLSRPKAMDLKRPGEHKKEKMPGSSKAPPKVKPVPNLMSHFKPKEEGMHGMFDMNMELPLLMGDKVERPAKHPRLEERKKIFEPEHKPLLNIMGDHLGKPNKTSSIFSPDNNESPKNMLSPFDKDSRKSDLHFSGHASKKPTSSLFSPPSLTSLQTHRSGSGSSSEREIVIQTAMPTSVIKTERDKRPEPDGALPILFDRPQEHIKREYKPDLTVTPPSQPAPFAAAATKSAGPVRQPGLADAGAIIFPPSEKPKISHIFPASVPSADPEPKPAGPVSTVNLLGMDKLVDTSISPNMAAVIKPLPTVRTDPLKLVLQPREPEKKVEEKVAAPSAEEAELLRKIEKKKNKDKDREKDRDGHRHKEKKEKREKSEGKKEKKKHKDKDKERKKDSHRDKEKRDRPKDGPDVPLAESHLRITIPKDKISLTSTEGPGLKIKIAKDRLKPEDMEISKPQIEGSLKIKIKKDAITNYKEEPAKSSSKKSSHSSHHKSSKASKMGDAAARSSKKSESKRMKPGDGE